MITCLEPSPAVRSFNNLSRSERKRLRTRAPLEHTLRILGIKPYDEAAIAVYKAKKLDELHNPKPKVHNRAVFIMWMLTLGIAMACLGGFYLHAANPYSHPAWGLLAAGICFIIVGLRGKVVPIATQEMPRLQAAWQTMSLHSYVASGLFVPREAQELAREIEMRCPGTRSSVEYLYQDPFLWVETEPSGGAKGERFAVYLWAEPEFEKGS